MEPLCRIKLSQGNDDKIDPSYSGPIPPGDIFSIDVELRYEAVNQETNLDSFRTLESSCRPFVFPRDMFLSEEYGPNLVISMCPNTGVSPGLIQKIIVPDIMSFARDIHNEPGNVGRNVIKLMIEVVTLVTDYGVNQLMIEDSLYTLNFKPATGSSIQELKRTTWDGNKKRRLNKGLSSKKGCSICLDEFVHGDEVASMPCGHVYHDSCIVKWLKTSHFCPLCRCEMPS